MEDSEENRKGKYERMKSFDLSEWKKFHGVNRLFFIVLPATGVNTPIPTSDMASDL